MPYSLHRLLNTAHPPAGDIRPDAVNTAHLFSLWNVIERMREEIIMFDAVNTVVKSVNSVVWGWGMIALIFGTHLF